MGVADDERLRELGYQPVLNRSWNKFTNAAVTISAMSVLLSVTASFGTGLTYGGPVVIIWGWIGVSVCCICVALGMAELASAYPTSGGMYFWMYMLLGPKYGPPACWINGWLNLLGQIASLASTHYFTAQLLQTFILLSTGTATPSPSDYSPPPPPDAPGAPYAPGQDESSIVADYVAVPPGPGFVWTPKQTLGLYAALLCLSAVINSFGGKLVQYLTEAAAYWHIIGMAILVIAIPCIATQHQSASTVFFQFDTNLGNDAGITSPAYIAMLGLLLPAYAYTGYDGPAHMAEESNDASIANPRGIMMGMYFMAITGWVWCISLLFSMSNREYILGDGDTIPAADGAPVPQIFWDAFVQRTGNGLQSLGMLMIPLVGVFFCSMSTLTYVSRIFFCYSRDRAVPLSWLWIKIAPNKVPVFAVWGSVTFAFIIAIPSIRNPLAFTAILSLSTIALNVAYVAPSFVRITFGRHRFKPGPWHLGKWAYPINIIATLWVCFAVVIFSLPTVYPVDANTNLNYAGIVLLGTLLLSVVWYWCPFIGAYRWFKGPVSEIIPGMDEELAKQAASQAMGMILEEASEIELLKANAKADEPSVSVVHEKPVHAHAL